jgi:hypothetical protein
MFINANNNRSIDEIKIPVSYTGDLKGKKSVVNPNKIFPTIAPVENNEYILALSASVKPSPFYK